MLPSAITSAALVLLVAVFSVIWAYFTLGFWSMRYIFTANFLAGAFIIVVGLLVFMAAGWPENGKLLDHSTYASRAWKARESKNEKARRIIYTGTGMIAITATIQYFVGS